MKKKHKYSIHFLKGMLSNHKRTQREDAKFVKTNQYKMPEYQQKIMKKFAKDRENQIEDLQLAIKKLSK